MRSTNRLAHLSHVDAAYSSRAPAHQGIISEATCAWIGCDEQTRQPLQRAALQEHAGKWDDEWRDRWSQGVSASHGITLRL
jgi:hypothetical protein